MLQETHFFFLCFNLPISIHEKYDWFEWKSRFIIFLCIKENAFLYVCYTFQNNVIFVSFSVRAIRVLVIITSVIQKQCLLFYSTMIMKILTYMYIYLAGLQNWCFSHYDEVYVWYTSSNVINLCFLLGQKFD